MLMARSTGGGGGMNLDWVIELQDYGQHQQYEWTLPLRAKKLESGLFGLHRRLRLEQVRRAVAGRRGLATAGRCDRRAS